MLSLEVLESVDSGKEGHGPGGGRYNNGGRAQGRGSPWGPKVPATVTFLHQSPCWPSLQSSCMCRDSTMFAVLCVINRRFLGIPVGTREKPGAHGGEPPMRSQSQDVQTDPEEAMSPGSGRPAAPYKR